MKRLALLVLVAVILNACGNPAVVAYTRGIMLQREGDNALREAGKMNNKIESKYFQAIEQRLQKASGGGHVRDRTLAQQIKPLWENYLELAARHRAQHVYSEQLESFRWLLEEFRISLFAQQLGTAVPVSAKRLQKSWDELR